MKTPNGAIVVGVDNSHHALEAVDWAYQAATSRERPVHLVSGLVWDLFEPLATTMDVSAVIDMARQSITDATARMPQDFAPRVTSQLVNQSPARLLVEASEQADMVVVGTRGHGGFAGMLLGSVSQHVSRHAHCNVAVVRPVATNAAADIVAGIDLSHRDVHVLRTAFEEARRREVLLRVVHAWIPFPPVAPGVGADPDEYLVKDRSRSEQDQLDHLLRTWEQDYPDVEVAHEALPGHPVRTLLKESENASLLVVGAHGGGAFAGLLLGSTTSALLHHARCPVLIAR